MTWSLFRSLPWSPLEFVLKEFSEKLYFRNIHFLLCKSPQHRFFVSCLKICLTSILTIKMARRNFNIHEFQTGSATKNFVFNVGRGVFPPPPPARVSEGLGFRVLGF